MVPREPAPLGRPTRARWSGHCRVPLRTPRGRASLPAAPSSHSYGSCGSWLACKCLAFLLVGVAAPCPRGQQTPLEGSGVEGWLSRPLPPPPHWLGGGGKGAGAARLSLMISCPHSGLTTASCHRRAGTERSRRLAERQVGLGRSGCAGGPAPHTPAKAWPEGLGITGLPPASADVPHATKQGEGAQRRAQGRHSC